MPWTSIPYYPELRPAVSAFPSDLQIRVLRMATLPGESYRVLCRLVPRGEKRRSLPHWEDWQPVRCKPERRCVMRGRHGREHLLGPNPDPQLIESLSSETPQTPPTFLFHTDGDRGVKPENSVLFYVALRKAGVPAEMHIYERGPQGVGLAPRDPILSTWPSLLEGWLKTRGLIR